MFFVFFIFKFGVIVNIVMIEFGRGVVYVNYYIFVWFVVCSFDSGKNRVKCIFCFF